MQLADVAQAWANQCDPRYLPLLLEGATNEGWALEGPSPTSGTRSVLLRPLRFRLIGPSSFIESGRYTLNHLGSRGETVLPCGFLKRPSPRCKEDENCDRDLRDSEQVVVRPSLTDKIADIHECVHDRQDEVERTVRPC